MKAKEVTDYMDERLFIKIKQLIERYREVNGYDCPFNYVDLLHIIETEERKRQYERNM